MDVTLIVTLFRVFISWDPLHKIFCCRKKYSEKRYDKCHLKNVSCFFQNDWCSTFKEIITLKSVTISVTSAWLWKEPVSNLLLTYGHFISVYVLLYTPSLLLFLPPLPPTHPSMYSLVCMSFRYSFKSNFTEKIFYFVPLFSMTLK